MPGTQETRTLAPGVYNPDVDEHVSINEAAARVGVSRRTINYWIAAGKIATCRTASGKTRVFVRSLWKD